MTRPWKHIQIERKCFRIPLRLSEEDNNHPPVENRLDRHLSVWAAVRSSMNNTLAKGRCPSERTGGPQGLKQMSSPHFKYHTRLIGMQERASGPFSHIRSSANAIRQVNWGGDVLMKPFWPSAMADNEVDVMIDWKQWKPRQLQMSNNLKSSAVDNVLNDVPCGGGSH